MVKLLVYPVVICVPAGLAAAFRLALADPATSGPMIEITAKTCPAASSECLICGPLQGLGE